MNEAAQCSAGDENIARVSLFMVIGYQRQVRVSDGCVSEGQGGMSLRVVIEFLKEELEKE